MLRARIFYSAGSLRNLLPVHNTRRLYGGVSSKRYANARSYA